MPTVIQDVLMHHAHAFTYGFYLWSMSTPGKNDVPRIDLTEDPAAKVTPQI